MARSLVETFAGLTLPQQRRVFDILRDVLEANERATAAGESLTASETRPGADER